MAHGVSYEIKGNNLIITVPIGQAACDSAPASSTGKTQLVASTSGAMPLMNTPAKNWGLSLALNLSAKKTG